MPLKQIILVLYFLHFILYAYLNVLYVAGFPARSLIIVLTGMIVIASDYRIIKSLGIVNYIYIIFAFLGLTVSLFNEVGLKAIFDGELKLFQSYLVILVSYYILKNFGFKLLGMVIIIIAIPTALIGILQALDFQAALNLHEVLGRLMGNYIKQKGRAPGLSHFAIPQAGLLLSVIIINCYFVLAVKNDTKLQYILFLLNMIFVLALIASQTRSALGASLIVISVVYFKSLNYKQLLPVGGALFVLVLISIVLLGDVENSNTRLASLEDQSAKDKLTLYKYSLELFVKQPFGYGFNFNTLTYANSFFLNENTVFDYDVFEKAQYLVPVHNAMAHIVITYGFIGLLFLFYYIYQITKFRWYHILFVSSVLLNSSFHNAGILNGDLNIDMIFAMFLYEKNIRKGIVNSETG